VEGRLPNHAVHSGQSACQGQWLDQAEVASKALPKPVAELLRKLCK